jgi:hypothetical protein
LLLPPKQAFDGASSAAALQAMPCCNQLGTADLPVSDPVQEVFCSEATLFGMFTYYYS